MEFLIAGERLFAGSAGFDASMTRAFAERVVQRSHDVAASNNHWLLEDGDPSPGGLDDITMPTLVIQGTEDPLFPVEHGEALARELPDARLVRLPGVGHQVPPRSSWEIVIPEILTQTADWEVASRRLAADALADGDATGWFDRLYAAGASGTVEMPWNRTTAHPLLASWTAECDTYAERALVVGCGLGADSEHLANLGFDTTAFDISETAVRTTRERYPNSAVHYRSADLLDPPAEWHHAYDLVVEIFTVQALPEPMRAQAITAVSDFVSSGGTLFVVAFADIGPQGDDGLPPWPLRRDEVEAFAGERLTAHAIDRVPHPSNAAVSLWQAEFRA